MVFCATQAHAALVRDFINQTKSSTDPNYCHRVTAMDGEVGEQHLRHFQDNEKTVPTVLTTSQKLSTGVDALNIRHIVLMRPIRSMIEFKQIIGRGTRTYEGKDFFTIWDFVKAHENFNDPEWDGEPRGASPAWSRARTVHQILHRTEARRTVVRGAILPRKSWSDSRTARSGPSSTLLRQRTGARREHPCLPRSFWSDSSETWLD